MNMLDNFLKYVSIDTTCDSSKNDTPSSCGQIKLAKLLVEELKSMNIDVYYDEKYCYVYGKLNGNKKLPKLGFVAHLDTAEYFKCNNMKTNVIFNYDGKDIMLDNNVIISSSKFPDLKKYIGKTLITSDGLAILGADDKAGIAEIMYMLNYLYENDIEHGDIFVCFNPDEEIGLGTLHLDKMYFNPDFVYVIDGGELGEVSYENFNAACVKISIDGTVFHYGKAKNLMVNAGEIAMVVDSMIPNERASNTEGREGFYHLKSVVGDVSFASIEYLICDFDDESFEKRKKKIMEVVHGLNEKYNNSIKIHIKCSYRNMYNLVSDKRHFIDNTIEATKKVNVQAKVVAHRGCTDAADISFSGIPSINLGIGVHNYHSVYEYIALEDMIKVGEILIEIVKCFSVLS